MELALVGVGEAGSRIVDRILAVEAETERTFSHGNALVCEISQTIPDDLDMIPEAQRFLIGDTHHAVDEQGVDGDPDLAVEVTQNDLPEIRRAFDSLPIHECDGILVVAGLGSGTGSGAGSVIIEDLQATYDEPVYALGVLPAESEGGQPAVNAGRALRSIVPAADSMLTFDRETWQPRVDEDGHDEAIHALAARVVTLFAAGELDASTVAENAVDSSDIIRTLAPGGLSSIGHAATELDTDSSGVIARLLTWLGVRDEAEPQTTDAAKVKSLVRQAANSRLTVPCDIASAERALVVLSGPPEELSRRGFESARQWLEQETDTVEILAGDDPRNGSPTLEAVVLFSNVTDVPRIDALQQQAVDYQKDAGGDRDEAAMSPDNQD
ncbi:tubulin/FtsZ family protein [Halobacterium sp. KA-6]|uniref:tubulin/FtsZ family protein n=1 Tax=Halobacterium sp. KA-6 TaxID=2896368 RepID=UPI001E401760|nr:tubulin/FtsZ family protein [Halobacterium sp. KA-6]MCD2204934.1 tubulin/FtsZ family protein [Halobacterium sp. KA-6]